MLPNALLISLLLLQKSGPDGKPTKSAHPGWSAYDACIFSLVLTMSICLAVQVVEDYRIKKSLPFL